MSKRCELQKEYYKEFGNYKGDGNYSDEYVKWLENEVLSLRIGSVSPRIDWVELRNNFFNECTTETPREESGKKVNIAPHDLFEWLKREISE